MIRPKSIDVLRRTYPDHTVSRIPATSECVHVTRYLARDIRLMLNWLPGAEMSHHVPWVHQWQLLQELVS